MSHKHLKDRLTGLKIADPIVFGLILLGACAVYFFLVPSGKRKTTRDVFLEKVADKQEDDARKAESVQERFEEKLDRRAETFEESKLLQEERRRAEFAEEKYRELKRQVESQEERFPRLRFLEEIQIKSFFAPVGHADADAETRERTAQAARTPDHAQAPRRDTATQETNRASAQASTDGERLEIRAGTWIPVVLNNAMHAGLAGHGTGMVRQDVFAADSGRVAVPKGSRVVLQFLKDDDYFLSALVAKEIITPDGRHLQIPLPVHDRQGASGLDPRQSGSFNRHLWAKIGMTALIAAVASAPNLVADNVGDLAQLSYVERTTQGLQSLLKSSLDIPNEKTFKAGAALNLLVVSSFTVPAGKDAGPDRAAYRAGMDALKARLFQYERLLEAQPKTLRENLRDHLEHRPDGDLVRGGN